MLKPLYTIAEAVDNFGLSRSRVYILLAEGKLSARKAGKRTLITAESLKEFADNLPVAEFRMSKAAR